MRVEAVQLVEEIRTYIETAGEKLFAGEKQGEHAEEAFEALALKLFAYQFRYNLAYKKYAQARRKTPLTVKRWYEIPPIPIQAYKAFTFCVETCDDVEAVFMTSGTTQQNKRGKQYHPVLTVWKASMEAMFRPYVMPDQQRMCVLVLSPASDVNPNSSLATYLSLAVQRFGNERSRFLYDAERGLDYVELRRELKRAVAAGEPVLLLGATFAYVHVLDEWANDGFHVKLPVGSRVLDTGGLKGQARDIAQEELYEALGQALAIPRAYCVNMYGMTELSSQLYDRQIRDGQEVMDHAYKMAPPWFRTQVLDPNTLEPVADGEVGVLAHYDLANWNSAVAILTEDQGYKDERGLVLLGRIQGSEARGCSIAIDQLLHAQKQGGGSE